MMMLNDHAARVRAITDLDSTLLVEAGAGSGKTALLAGRVVYMLAAGHEPGSIAAVTFTEMAASELLGRIDRFAHEVANGRIPADLRAAFGDQATPEQVHNLRSKRPRINEITCTTIHGFCQRLLKPYPVEAGIDPGAQVYDPAQADLAFADVFDRWIRERLSGQDYDLDILTVLASHGEVEDGIAMIKEVAYAARRTPGAEIPHAEADAALWSEFVSAVDGFRDWCSALGFEAEGNQAIVEGFGEAAEVIRNLDASKPHVAVSKVANLVRSPAYIKADGDFRQYRMKGKWTAAAPSKKQGEEANEAACAHYERCAAGLAALRDNAAAAGLSLLAAEIQPLLVRFHNHKLRAAALDFEDLLVATRRLLIEHPHVAEELGQRFSRILVDEYQDTDPIQTDIFLRLAFRQQGNTWVPKPGAIFLVGDPKQAIYRFRGADVHAYVKTRDMLKENDPASVLTVTTNFRSRKPILDYVNATFAAPLMRPGQPGFANLDAFRQDLPECGVPVAAFTVDGHEYASEARDFEAALVAEMCSRLIGSFPVYDKDQGLMRECEAKDIALLAPTGTDLWRYENALEDLGISVSTQAGKGMFHQQEVQDLIAVTRVLADPRDRLALGALLRGPLVGLTETELLDESCRLESGEDGKLSFIEIGVGTGRFESPVLRETMDILNSLSRRAGETAPHAILSEAVELLNVRATLKLRKPKSPERSLANVDRYLELSRAYSVRGLRAFSDDMRERWESRDKMAEGRPDSEEQSVSLITMHSAKGLEWNVVIPVNTLTDTLKPSPIIVNSRERRMTMPFLGMLPAGYVDERLAAVGEDEAERARLWYVACTRARDLLVLPRHENPGPKSWASLVDLKLQEVGSIDLSAYPMEPGVRKGEEANEQDAGTFLSEAMFISESKKPVLWSRPSRSEYSPMLTESLSLDEMIVAEPETDFYATVQGGRERGDVLHKLIEEVLTGETEESHPALLARAAELVEQYRSLKGCLEAELRPDELARTVSGTLAIPQVATLREKLVPEVATYASYDGEGREVVVNGVIDAAEWKPGGEMGVVIDWKSDVRPTAEATENYREQVSKYLRMNGVPKGLIVFMSTGQVVEVAA